MLYWARWIEFLLDSITETFFLKIRSGSYFFCEQSGRAIQLHGAGLWAGLQSEQEHTGSCGLQSASGQEEGETDGGERRISPGGGIVGGRVGRLGLL